MGILNRTFMALPLIALLGCTHAGQVGEDSSQEWTPPAIRRADHDAFEKSRMPASPQQDGVYCGVLTSQPDGKVKLSDEFPNVKAAPQAYHASVPNELRHDPGLFMTNGALKQNRCVCVHGLVEGPGGNPPVRGTASAPVDYQFSVVHSYEVLDGQCYGNVAGSF